MRKMSELLRICSKYHISQNLQGEEYMCFAADTAYAKGEVDFAEYWRVIEFCKELVESIDRDSVALLGAVYDRFPTTMHVYTEEGLTGLIYGAVIDKLESKGQ